MSKYGVVFSKKFSKDIKLAKAQGKDINKLFDVVSKLAEGIPLEPKYRDHSLSGEYAECRECHITPDWLLIYTRRDDVLILLLNRTGSHSDLF